MFRGRPQLSALPAVALALLVAVCTAGAGTALAQELVDNPQYTSWAKHKPGTSVTMKMTQAMGGQNRDMELKQTLKEVTPDQVTIELQMSAMGQQMPATPLTIKKKVTPDEAKYGQLPPGAKADVKEVGNETVTVAGKEYNCKVSEVTGEAQGSKSKGKLWRSEEVPGEVVKMEMTSEGTASGSMKMEIVVPAPCDGRVHKLFCREGAQVAAGQDLLVIEAAA